MSPLIKSCSKKALGKNIGAEIRAGKPKDQAVAIGLSTLRKSCGVESDKKLTPSEIVARKKTEAKEPFKAKLSSQLGNISAQDVDAVKEVIKSNAFMALRQPLTKLGFKVDFTTEPFAMYTIKKAGSSLVILNKKYVDNPDFVHGEIAMGLNEAVEKSIFTSLLSDVCGLVGVKSRALGEKKEDLVGDIMAWEGGEMSGDETLEFFSKLVKNGQAWKLQGVYGRTAQSFIDAGYLDKNGKILKQVEEPGKPAWEMLEAKYDHKLASEKIGSGDLPNRYYVVASNTFLASPDGTNSYDDAWDVKEFKSIIGKADAGKPIGMYDTFAEALAAWSQVYDEIPEEPTEGALHSVVIEDHVSGEIYAGHLMATKKKFGWKFNKDYEDETSFTSKTLGYDIRSEKPEVNESEGKPKIKKGDLVMYHSKVKGPNAIGVVTNVESLQGDKAIWRAEVQFRDFSQGYELSALRLATKAEKDIWLKLVGGKIPPVMAKLTEGLTEAGRRKGGRGITDSTVEDLIRNGHEDAVRDILKRDGWNEDEIKSYIQDITGIAEAVESKHTVSKKPIMSWDTNQIAEDRIKDIMENPGDNEYVFDDNEEIMDAWEESKESVKEFFALLKKRNLYDDFESLAKENAYADSDHNDIEWESLKDYLTEKMEEKNPDGYWNASVKNFGWRSLHGEKYFEAHDGEKLLEKILPDTNCTFYIYDFGKDGLAINNFHHDSPMGKEWYYITPVSHAEFENEGPISQAAVVDDLMNSGDFYTGFHSKSGPVSGTREEIRAHVVKALEAEAKAQAKNIEVEEFTEGDTAELIHVTLVFPDKSNLDVSLEIALEGKDGKYSSRSADIGNTNLDEKNYVVQESVEEALGASGKPLNFPMRGSDPANIDIDSIKVEKMDLRTGESWYVSWMENGERRASIRSWWDKAEADKLADNMRASIKSQVKTEAAAGITGNDWWKHYVNRFDAETWAKKGKNIGVNDGAFTAFDAEWTEWEVKFQEKLDRIIAALKSGEELPPRDLATPDTKTWGGKTTKALIELLGIKSVKDKADLRNKLKEKLVGMTEADRSMSSFLWMPDFDDVDVNAKIDLAKFDPFEKSVIEKLTVGGVPKAKAVVVFINTFGEKGDDQLSPYMLELKTMLKKKGMLTEADEYGKGLRRYTPWGQSDGEQELADGIVDVQTPGHGGIWLSPERQKQLNWSKNFLKNATWWEEDSDWAIPYYFFRDDIKASGKAHEFEKNLAAAIGTIKRDHKEFAKRENLTEEKLVETGEADQDYEKEFYDELVKQLAAAGYKGATHREFDKYQGVVLSVPGVDKFWVKDFFTRGEIDDVDKKKPYRSTVMTNPEGEEVSSSNGDYFQLPKDYAFKGFTLVLTKQNGETITKKNPKRSDLPDITDVMSTFSYKRGSMSEHTIMYPEHDNKVEIEVVKDADGKVQAAGLIRYCKTHKLKKEAVGESWVGND